jgi:VIT1/CCC1 family predicted Fe2+/Mn2+ transporter
MITAAEQHEPVLVSDRVRHYLPDLIYGANDGIITTFAIVSGAAGASLSATTALILGLANLFADGFSMGASNVLAIQSQQAVRGARGLPVDEPFPTRHGAATFFAFLVAGAVPLIAYAITSDRYRFVVAVFVTLLTLFIVGALRALVTLAMWWRAGMQMLMIGAVAAGVSYGIGAVLRGWIQTAP